MSWSSERVPLSSTHTTRTRAAALLPLSSGRTLPSKWDDAERWISSPVLPPNSHSFRSQRRSKSHSLQIGPTTTTDNSNNDDSNNDFVGEELEECTRQWLILLNDPSQDERSDEEGVAAGVGTSYALDHPQGSSATTSSYSSPSPNRVLCLPPPEEMPLETTVDQEAGDHVTVKDVKVDKEGSFRPTRPRKVKYKSREDGRPSFTGSDLAISTSKSQREEAKINAWENLQRANAEAAIRKLEMKLEKKRAAKIDKILKKLQRDELKAEKMRRSISKNNGSTRKASQRITELCRRIRMSSITNFLPRT